MNPRYMRLYWIHLVGGEENACWNSPGFFLLSLFALVKSANTKEIFPYTSTSSEDINNHSDNS